MQTEYTNQIDYKKYTIHIVDDSLLVIETLKKVLKAKEYNVTYSQNGQDALKAILEDKPDLIILDIEMPIMDGYETIKHLKHNKNTKNIPIIFYTAEEKGESIGNLFELGASDYITKPFIPQELLARVEKEIKNIMLQNMLKEKMSKLAEALSLDKVTNTSNKMHMTSLIKANLGKLKLSDKAIFSLIYIDIDNFSYFIRMNGMTVLEMVQKKIAIIIKRSVRTKDIISHWHGDEFMVMCPKISEDELNKIAIKIRDSISKAPFSPNANLTCCISLLQISDSQTINVIIEKLESRMKDIKSKNKNSIVMSNGRLLV